MIFVTFISNISSLLDSLVFNCSQCDGDLCDVCTKEHLLNYSKHKISAIKYISQDNILQSNCSQCGKNLNNINNYKNCENCKIPFCIKCGDNNKKKYKYHNIISIKNEKNNFIYFQKTIAISENIWYTVFYRIKAVN